MTPSASALSVLSWRLVCAASAADWVRSLSDCPSAETRASVAATPPGLEPAAELQESGEVVFQREGLLQRGAQLVDLAPQLLRFVRRLGELCLGATLAFRDRFGLFVECGEDGNEPLERFDAALELAHDFLRFRDRLGELRQVLRGVPRRVRKPFEGHAFPLDLGQDGAELSGELLRRNVAPKELPAGHGQSSQGRVVTHKHRLQGGRPRRNNAVMRRDKVGRSSHGKCEDRPT